MELDGERDNAMQDKCFDTNKVCAAIIRFRGLVLKAKNLNCTISESYDAWTIFKHKNENKFSCITKGGH